MTEHILNQQPPCKARAFLIPITDDLLGQGYGCDLQILADDATLEDFMLALDQFAAQYMADCKGCDSCCQERAPLIAPDIPRLASLLPASPWPAHAVIAAFGEITVENGVTDITFRRPNGMCIHLDAVNRCCRHWPERAFVCRSHFCLPRSERIAELRGEIVNAGENELTRLLLAEEANGAPPLTQRPLRELVNPQDYAEGPLKGYTSYTEILLKDVLSPTLWQELRQNERKKDDQLS